jgi:hypothetical protein
VFQRTLLQRNDKPEKDRFQNNVLGYIDISDASAVLRVRTKHPLPLIHELLAEGGSWLQTEHNARQ